MPTVLIVDDSSVERRVVYGLLDKETQWRLTEARDGEEALGMIEQQLPDLVLTDLQMPGMDGLQLTQEIRRRFPLVPVVLMTAQGSEEIAVQALECGAASYVPKSDLVRQLTDVLDRVMAAAGEKRSLSQLMRCLTEWRASFQLESDAALVLSLVAHLQRVMSEMRLFDESERLRVGVALEEALLNAAHHGNLEISSDLREEDHTAYYQLARDRLTEEPYAGRRIRVDAILNPDRAEFVIADEGPGFDPSSLPDPTDPANLDRPCGRGLLLMRTFMDDLSYNETGNQVRLVKRSDRPSEQQSGQQSDRGQRDAVGEHESKASA